MSGKTSQWFNLKIWTDEFNLGDATQPNPFPPAASSSIRLWQLVNLFCWKTNRLAWDQLMLSNFCQNIFCNIVVKISCCFYDQFVREPAILILNRVAPFTVISTRKYESLTFRHINFSYCLHISCSTNLFAIWKVTRERFESNWKTLLIEWERDEVSAST